MTSTPLPSKAEEACVAAARTMEDVLLVGADPVLLERAARRIHDLTVVNRRRPRKMYVSDSCRGKGPDWAVGTDRRVKKIEGGRYVMRYMYIRARLELYVSDYDTVHLSDVESVSDEAGNEIWCSLYVDGQARLIFSSTIEPEQWARGTRTDVLLSELRQLRRLDLGVLADETAPNAPGLTVRQDDEGRWIFKLRDKQYPPVNGRVDGFHYLKILCDSPGREFTPKELRDRMKPNRTSPKGADTDRARVRNAVDLVLDPKKNIPSEVRSHLVRNRHLRYGTVNVYRPVPE
jgi:hypothetical protein